jgi:hypothetical protein
MQHIVLCYRYGTAHVIKKTGMCNRPENGESARVVLHVHTTYTHTHSESCQYHSLGEPKL